MLYDKPLWQILIEEYLPEAPVPFASSHTTEWFREHYPKFNPKSVRAHLRAMSANDPLKQHHPHLPHDVFLKIGRGLFQAYDAERDGLFDELGRGAGEIETDEADLEALDPDLDGDAASFALEFHLEEFIEANWDRINFGRPLRLFVGPNGETGRQFKTDIGPIDFLCQDSSTGAFVILELKKGRSSDRALGQCQRYMGWVRAHLAKPDQEVRGFIIAQERDEQLRYALLVAGGVEMRCFRVDFQLFDPDSDGTRA